MFVPEFEGLLHVDFRQFLLVQEYLFVLVLSLLYLVLSLPLLPLELQVIEQLLFLLILEFLLHFLEVFKRLLFLKHLLIKKLSFFLQLNWRLLENLHFAFCEVNGWLVHEVFRCWRWFLVLFLFANCWTKHIRCCSLFLYLLHSFMLLWTFSFSHRDLNQLLLWILFPFLLFLKAQAFF